ncbi:hypothetical protein Q5752_003089 [Cryptotrichosporon argae]
MLPPTHLPITFPLAFPTPRHALNLLCTQHLLAHVLSHPSHAGFFASSPSSAAETATRGVLALFLVSPAGWDDAANLLALPGWRRITPDRVAELFAIPTHTERRHESLPVTVGEVDKAAQAVVGALTETLRALGELDSQCLADHVVSALEGEHGDVAARFCEQATALIPALADPYALPAHALPSAPLMLLQDLSTYLSRAPDPVIALPPPAELDARSPLPLALAPCIYLGLLETPHRARGSLPVDTLLGPPLVEPPVNGTGRRAGIDVVSLPAAEWAELRLRSLEVCAAVSDATGKSYADVCRLFGALHDGMTRHGVGYAIAI